LRGIKKLATNLRITSRECCLEAWHAFIKLRTSKIDFIIAKSLTLIKSINFFSGVAVHNNYA